jgi:hypothetical protein
VRSVVNARLVRRGTGLGKVDRRRGKVKTKHDITWFAQKTNVGRSVESSLRI